MTKTGEIAGPRILEHIVDAVFYMEVFILYSRHPTMLDVAFLQYFFFFEFKILFMCIIKKQDTN